MSKAPIFTPPQLMFIKECLHDSNKMRVCKQLGLNYHSTMNNKRLQAELKRQQQIQAEAESVTPAMVTHKLAEIAGLLPAAANDDYTGANRLRALELLCRVKNMFNDNSIVNVEISYEDKLKELTEINQSKEPEMITVSDSDYEMVSID